MTPLMLCIRMLSLMAGPMPLQEDDQRMLDEVISQECASMSDDPSDAEPCGTTYEDGSILVCDPSSAADPA